MDKDERVRAAIRYTCMIRNKEKARYAAAYVDHLVHGGPAPAEPKGLNIMGAQAVRHAISSILKTGSR